MVKDQLNINASLIDKVLENDEAFFTYSHGKQRFIYGLIQLAVHVLVEHWEVHKYCAYITATIYWLSVWTVCKKAMLCQRFNVTSYYVIY